MAKAVTDEQVQLRRRARRRLIGAIALVTLVAVLLPWVLEHEPRPSDQEVSIRIPSQDSRAFNPEAMSGPGQDKHASEGNNPDASESGTHAVPAGGDEALKAEQDKVLAPPVKPSPSSSAQPKQAAPPQPTKSAAKSDAATHGKAYVVQVTALADAGKAAEIRRKLAAKGMKAYTEKVKTASGEVTRVRVGPFPSREAAERERGRIKTLGFDGNVTPR